MKTNQAESREQRAESQKRLSKGPGSLLFSLTTIEYALALFLRARSKALNFLNQAQRDLGSSETSRDLCLKWAREEGAEARKYYHDFCVLKAEALASGSGVAA